MKIRDANRFVEHFHRHNRKVPGAKFAIGLMVGNELIGVAIAGRPLARALDDGQNIEITRVCVKDGFKNANSMLYGRMRRICELFGYKRIITYTLTNESGSSLAAIGASPTPIPAHSWKRPQRNRPQRAIYKEPKIRWELPVNEVA